MRNDEKEGQKIADVVNELSKQLIPEIHAKNHA
jgi:hypothetical protein